jgi:hypothetical protein
MDTHTAAIAADSARVNASTRSLKLHIVRHKYAQITVHARPVGRHKHKLLWLHASINT